MFERHTQSKVSKGWLTDGNHILGACLKVMPVAQPITRPRARKPCEAPLPVWCFSAFIKTRAQQGLSHGGAGCLGTSGTNYLRPWARAHPLSRLTHPMEACGLSERQFTKFNMCNQNLKATRLTYTRRACGNESGCCLDWVPSASPRRWRLIVN